MHRIYEIRCPDGTTHYPRLEGGRWYGLDGLPWHVVAELCRTIEVSTPAVPCAEWNGYRIVGEVVG
jgi:hypothetical protein